MTRSFIDTNLIVYNYASREPTKYERSSEVLKESERICSTQVLSELANVLSKKFHFAWPTIGSILAEVTDVFTVRTISTSTIHYALRLAERYHYSFYDSLILSAALEARCEVLYSEDLQHNQVVEDIRIINPFL